MTIIILATVLWTWYILKDSKNMRKAITKRDAKKPTKRQNLAAIEVAKATTALKAGEPNSLRRVSNARKERRAAAQSTDSNNK